ANGSPAYAGFHREAVSAQFMRVMSTGIAPNFLYEQEAVEKGAAFLKPWKVIFLPGLNYATPAFKKVLEEYCAAGGKLVQLKTDTLEIKGAIKADHPIPSSAEYFAKLDQKAMVIDPGYRDNAIRKWNTESAPTFAKDLTGWIGERPYRSGNPAVFVGVHAAGDATFLLIANDAHDKADTRGMKYDLVPAETTITVPKDG